MKDRINEIIYLLSLGLYERKETVALTFLSIIAESPFFFTVRLEPLKVLSQKEFLTLSKIQNISDI